MDCCRCEGTGEIEISRVLHKLIKCYLCKGTGKEEMKRDDIETYLSRFLIEYWNAREDEDVIDVTELSDNVLNYLNDLGVLLDDDQIVVEAGVFNYSNINKDTKH